MTVIYRALSMCQTLISSDILRNIVKLFILFPTLDSENRLMLPAFSQQRTKSLGTSIFTQGHPWRHLVVKPASAAIITYLHCHFA